MKKKTLVLGANGFMGSKLCQELSDQGVSVVGYDVSMPTVQYQGIEYCTGDFTSEERFDELLEGVDTIFHLISTTIPTAGTENIYREMSENVVPTVRLLESMTRCGIPKIIFASSGGTVYGDTKKINHTTDPLHPICSYGVQKKMIESLLELYSIAHGIVHRIVRISNVYGIGQNRDRKQGIIPIFTERMFKQLPITIYGDTYRDYIYMDDVIHAFMAVAKYDGIETVFNIGMGISYTIREVLKIIEQQIDFTSSSIEETAIRPFDVSESRLDISTTKQELNWFPEISLEEGVRRVVSYYRSN